LHQLEQAVEQGIVLALLPDILPSVAANDEPRVFRSQTVKNFVVGMGEGHG
jgi:hypothetical protein